MQFNVVGRPISGKPEATGQVITAGSAKEAAKILYPDAEIRTIPTRWGTYYKVLSREITGNKQVWLEPKREYTTFLQAQTPSVA